MSDETIFTQKIDTGHREPQVIIDYQEFKKVIDSRRSVRVFSKDKVSDTIIDNALDDALKAPNSSNLQPWKFVWVKSEAKREELARYCFSQNGAKTAQHMIICIAQTGTWKEHCQMTLDQMKKMGMEVPSVVTQYYTKIAPVAYGLIGPWGVLSPLKWLLFNTLGVFRVSPREPIWPSDLKTWAVKSTALACENFMLSIRAQGFDTLPMEGFDAKRVKRMCDLGGHDHPMMIIAVGKRDERGIYGPQMRFPRDRFVEKI